MGNSGEKYHRTSTLFCSLIRKGNEMQRLWIFNQLSSEWEAEVGTWVFLCVYVVYQLRCRLSWYLLSKSSGVFFWQCSKRIKRVKFLLGLILFLILASHWWFGYGFGLLLTLVTWPYRRQLAYQQFRGMQTPALFENTEFRERYFW